MLKKIESVVLVILSVACIVMTGLVAKCYLTNNVSEMVDRYCEQNSAKLVYYYGVEEDGDVRFTTYNHHPDGTGYWEFVTYHSLVDLWLDTRGGN